MIDLSHSQNTWEGVESLDMASDDVIIGTHMAQMIKVIKAKGKAKGKAGKKCPKRERETRNSSSNSKKAD